MTDLEALSHCYGMCMNGRIPMQDRTGRWEKELGQQQDTAIGVLAQIIKRLTDEGVGKSG